MKLDLQKKTILNVDETWIGMTDFRRMKWGQRSQTNGVAKKNL